MTVYACGVCSDDPEVSELTLPLSPEPSVIRNYPTPLKLSAAKSYLPHYLNVQKLRPKLPKNMDLSVILRLQEEKQHILKDVKDCASFR